jgi:hypothetical protein
MEDWSYGYAARRHAELRKQREKVVLDILEKWLSVIVGPHLESSQPLPLSFTGTMKNDLGTYDVPAIVDELLVMSSKLGWNLELSYDSHGQLKIRVAQSSAAHVISDSDWDIERVLVRKKRNDTEKIKAMICTCVEPHLGRSSGMPDVFPLDSAGWVDLPSQHVKLFAALGWRLENTNDGRWQIRKA